MAEFPTSLQELVRTIVVQVERVADGEVEEWKVSQADRDGFSASPDGSVRGFRYWSYDSRMAVQGDFICQGIVEAVPGRLTELPEDAVRLMEVGVFPSGPQGEGYTVIEVHENVVVADFLENTGEFILRWGGNVGEELRTSQINAVTPVMVGQRGRLEYRATPQAGSWAFIYEEGPR